MVDVRRGINSQNFPYAALVWAIVASSQPWTRTDYVNQDNEWLLHQAVCLPTLHASQVYHLPVCKAPYAFYIFGNSFPSTFKTTTFLMYPRLTSITEDWITHLRHTPQGCFPASLSKCRFLSQIIILAFTIFTLRPLSSRCFFL